MPPSSSRSFAVGAPVEVIKLRNDTVSVSYYPAVVVKPVSSKQETLSVEYETLTVSESPGSSRIIETINARTVRPLPPRDFNEYFKTGDSVDVYCDSGWQRGTVKEILENSQYVVGFDGKMSEGIVTDQCNLRVHREWNGDGSWVPPLFHKREIHDIEHSNKRIKVNIKYSSGRAEKMFIKGMVVEVRSDEDGYQGAWYGASIVNTFGNGKYLVQYLNLVTDDYTAPLREVADVDDIRPFPPQVPSVGIFELYHKVDAWFNEGWWEGVISGVLNGFKYKVYFSSTHENLEFEQSELRPHQEWVNGKWVMKNEVLSGSNSIELFRRGTKVEVKTDEAGFVGAWLVASIVEAMNNDKYVVQYLNLLTDDETAFLREEARASDIRPSPPDILRSYPYELSELVDAWYNDAWWVGRVVGIVKVQEKLRYKILFKTAEILKFEHQDLRPHQEWISGNWFILSEA